MDAQATEEILRFFCDVPNGAVADLPGLTALAAAAPPMPPSMGNHPWHPLRKSFSPNQRV